MINWPQAVVVRCQTKLYQSRTTCFNKNASFFSPFFLLFISTDIVCQHFEDNFDLSCCEDFSLSLLIIKIIICFMFVCSLSLFFRLKSQDFFCFPFAALSLFTCVCLPLEPFRPVVRKINFSFVFIYNFFFAFFPLLFNVFSWRMLLIWCVILHVLMQRCWESKRRSRRSKKKISLNWMFVFLLFW